ncbi:histidine kinase dimerization/phosphoacceptor domain -containing protein [Danxiaibacter flavus]|uniref:histidine kinase n=1 Tax=Danxiaibacter flavus TaxID=3049108 RepID=A0ABV3ZJD8_9BACT|nr:histidine kinase dimerization/phosphoacceptor domain -containing protein [Chitinophagaceae bacterium DXS]
MSYYSFIIRIVILLLLPLSLGAQQQANPEYISRLLETAKADTATVSELQRAGEFFLYKPGANPDDMGMVHRFASKIESISAGIHYLKGQAMGKLLHAQAYREAGSKQGRQLCEEAVAMLRNSNLRQLYAQAIIELGGTYANTQQDLPVKIDYYRQGAEMLGQMGDKLSEAKLKEFIAELLQLNGSNRESIAMLNETLAIYQSAGYPRLHGLYSVMAESYHRLDDFVESLRYNLMAVDVGEKLEDTGELMTTVYNRVGLNYYSIQYFDQALDYFNKALAGAHYNRDTPVIQNMLVNIADALRGKGQHRRSLDTLAMAATYGPTTEDDDKIHVYQTYLKNYLALKGYANADKYSKKLLQIYQHDKLSGTMNQVVRMSAVAYLQARERFEETIPLLAAFDRDKDSAFLPLARKVEAAYLFFRTDSALGHLSAAITRHEQYKMLSDSLTNINQARQLGVLQLQFETQQKDKNIEILTQKSKLQDASLQKEKMFRNVFVVGVCMLAVVSSLLYNRYRYKTRSNQKLESKQKKINQQNEVLKKLVDEKEWLLKEVHHRVKNNLQIVISLLNTQSEYLNNADAIAAIRNSQHRMHAMSLIHQRLYQVENLGKIDMEWYVRELITYMKESFEYTDKIRFVVDVKQVCLDSAQAVPVGLIINEAVTNAIKYAFPNGRPGTITLALKHAAEGGCLLQISDDGVGLPQDYDVEQGDSLGMSLMHGLADQLDGTLQLTTGENGVRITLAFKCRFLQTNTLQIA